MKQYTKNQLSHYLLPPKKTQTLYTFLSQKEIRSLIDSIDISGPLGIRNRALIEFMYSTGARVSEVEGLSIDNIDIENSETKLLGKGRKTRIAYLNKNAKEWLAHYIQIRGQFLFSTKKSSYQEAALNSSINNNALFLNRFGNRLSTEA